MTAVVRTAQRDHDFVDGGLVDVNLAIVVEIGLAQSRPRFGSAARTDLISDAKTNRLVSQA